MPTGVYERNKYPFEWYHSKLENVFIAGKQKLKLPPLEILKWIFRYDSETGKLYKIRESSGKVVEPEREITTVSSRGYLVVSITDSSGTKKDFKVHQIIYYMVSAVEPLQLIDHKNGVPTDNRFGNLRLVNESLNNRNRGMSRNNTSGITGVTWYKPTRKWMAYAKDNSGKKKHLGYFIDKDESIATVSAFYSNPLNGYSERHGLPLED